MKIQISENKLKRLIREAVEDTIEDTNAENEIRHKLARKILGTDSFEEFYRNTSFFVSPYDLHRMSKYFDELAKAQEQQNY